MNSPEEATRQHRFISKLCANYDGRKMGLPLLATHAQSQIPYDSGIDSACRLPCLSLLGGHLRDVSPSIGDPKSHSNLTGLLSRKVEYKQASLAASSLLRNLISSFGKILEIELRNRLYKLTCKLDDVEYMHHKNAILKAFEEQSLSNESPAVPIMASANFSIVRSLPQSPNDSRESRSDQCSRDSAGAIGLVYDARIRLYIMSNGEVATCHFKAPARITSHRHKHHGSNVNVEMFDIDIDTTKLYNVIRKECKIISKHIINAIVGFDIFEKRSSPRSRRRKEPEKVMEENESLLHLDENSHKTAMSTVITEPSQPIPKTRSSDHLQSAADNIYKGKQDPRTNKIRLQETFRGTKTKIESYETPVPEPSNFNRKERRRVKRWGLCRFRQK